MQNIRKVFLLLSGLFALILSPLPGMGQAPMPPKHAGQLAMELKHMQVLGSVLYIAAHPDDENTRLLAYLAGEKGYRTAYLSLTRGDGGQNLIGEERGSSLGVLRTQELLAARRVDGAEQYFSRALDFGYSKTPEETLKLWDREKILGDVVWVIRKFRPDVIITRFAGPERGGGGHGHHTTSAILAKEAFDLAADPAAYPEQLRYVQPWQPKRLFWNLYTWRDYEPSASDKRNILEVEIDTYNPLLGKGYGEIAAEARSMHKCQAFGTGKIRGGAQEKLLLLKGDLPSSDVLEGLTTGWDRIKGGEVVQRLLENAYDNFHPERPERIVPLLLDIYKWMRDKDDPWITYKRDRLKSLIAYCSGLYFEANSGAYRVANQDTFDLTTSYLIRSKYPVKVDHVAIGIDDHVFEVDAPLVLEDGVVRHQVRLPVRDFPLTQPYWLERPSQGALFDVREQRLIGLPETPPALTATFTFIFGGGEPVPIAFTTPVVHKYVDRAQGELYRPLIVSPPVAANIAETVYIFPNDQAQQVKVVVKNLSKIASEASMKVILPEGWTSEPEVVYLSFSEPGQEKVVSLSVSPPSYPSEGKLGLSIYSRNDTFQSGYQEIAYDHIPAQTIFTPAETRIVKLDLKKRGNAVAYIMGSGDEVPTALRQIGYQVDLLADDEINFDRLSQYDAVISGIRAYNTRERLVGLQDEIFNYIREGGTYIAQYNTTGGLLTRRLAPYSLEISHDRVSEEDAAIRFLRPEHPVLNYPNKITQKDFEGWVQERGLYFPNKWDDAFEAILSSNDTGEDPKSGGLLVGKYGKGYYIYSGISWFRELPAGVPGAFRLFTNLISIGKSADYDGK